MTPNTTNKNNIVRYFEYIFIQSKQRNYVKKLLGSNTLKHT